MPAGFKKILIANRGEIACRIVRTCKTLEIPCVAVYSECDRMALHVQMADEAAFIGPSPSSHSYLRIERILDAAKKHGCDSIHPGYGFLAENALFAESCESAGVAFIGPPAHVIRKMGDKEETRRTLQQYGVPVVPGKEDIQSAEDIRQFGQEVGWPVLIKATAGGGGKGMKLVHHPHEVEDAWESARSIAEKSFGNGRVYVEKYIEHGRHIEFQFLADQHGNAVHLFERECSIQRSHQKLVEEAPSTALTPQQRQDIGQRVADAVRQIGYVTAGTMEFLYSPEGQLYALEVNTRIQVEHTITELITGHDLIRLMIETRAGRPLPFRQEDLHFQGHAIQCRINAEDPQKGFQPSAQRITYLRESGGPFVRVDSGVYQGWKIPVYYDSLVAKLCVFGETRERAIQHMRRALGEYQVVGVKTTLPMHTQIMHHPAFLSGQYNTGFLSTFGHDVLDYHEPENEAIKLAKLLAESTALGRNQHCF